MATVIPIGKPVNEAERRTICHLRDHLSGDQLLMLNSETALGERLGVSVDAVVPLTALGAAPQRTGGWEALSATSPCRGPSLFDTLRRWCPRDGA